MKLRSRADRLRRTLGALPPPDQLALVTAVPVGCDLAEGRPPGVYPNADGRVATVVFAGPEPDPAVLGPVESRVARWGLVVVSHPTEETTR